MDIDYTTRLLILLIVTIISFVSLSIQIGDLQQEMKKLQNERKGNDTDLL